MTRLLVVSWSFFCDISLNRKKRCGYSNNCENVVGYSDNCEKRCEYNNRKGIMLLF